VAIQLYFKAYRYCKKCFYKKQRPDCWEPGSNIIKVLLAITTTPSILRWTCMFILIFLLCIIIVSMVFATMLLWSMWR